ncbi:MAG: hypothetical protein KC457_10705 [Myxococcales bacterium]|nr:hypothetical protein [Myxococcales bacterium]
MQTQVDNSEGRRRQKKSGVEVIDRSDVEPMSLVRWAKDSSCVVIARITPQVSVVSSRGPGHPGSRDFYTEHGPTTCCEADSVIFWDLGGLLSTDLGVVGICVGVGKNNRHNIAAVHMYYDSPMVGMAVTVANVALRGLIHFHREPQPFFEAFDRAVAHNAIGLT